MPPKKNVIDIMVDGKKESVDLTKRCPKQFGNYNGNKQWFIPVSLVRQIQRAVGFTVKDKQMDHKSVQTPQGVDVIMSARVVVEVDGKDYCGYALSALRYTAIAKSGFGQPGRIVSVAIKDALKQCYAFFEGDYAEGENDSMEDIAEKNSIDDVMDDILGVTPAQQAAPKKEVKASAPVEDPTPTKQEVFDKQFLTSEILSFGEPISSQEAGVKIARLVIEKHSLKDNADAKKILVEVLNELKDAYVKEQEKIEAKRKADEEKARKKAEAEAEAKKKAEADAQSIGLDDLYDDLQERGVLPEPVATEEVATPEETAPVEEVLEAPKPSAVPKEPVTPVAPKQEAGAYDAKITKWLSDNGVERSNSTMANCMKAIIAEDGIAQGSEEFNELKKSVLTYGK